MHRRLGDLEHYNDTKFNLEGVYKGAQSEAVLVHLQPGQEVPPHPHERFEVVLLPQKGEGLLNVNGRKEVTLTPGTLYYEEVGHVFGIKNVGTTPFQMLVILIRTDPPASVPGAPE